MFTQLLHGYIGVVYINDPNFEHLDVVNTHKLFATIGKKVYHIDRNDKHGLEIDYFFYMQ